MPLHTQATSRACSAAQPLRLRMTSVQILLAVNTNRNTSKMNTQVMPQPAILMTATALTMRACLLMLTRLSIIKVLTPDTPRETPMDGIKRLELTVAIKAGLWTSSAQQRANTWHFSEPVSSLPNLIKLLLASQEPNVQEDNPEEMVSMATLTMRSLTPTPTQRALLLHLLPHLNPLPPPVLHHRLVTPAIQQATLKTLIRLHHRLPPLLPATRVTS